MKYTAKNITNQTGLSTPRKVIKVNGRKLYPERTIQFDEFTSDILKHMMEGNIQVSSETEGIVTVESLKENYEIKKSTQTRIETTATGGTRQIKQPHYKLVEKDTKVDQEVQNSKEVVEETEDEETEDEEEVTFVEMLVNEKAISEDDTLSTVELSEVESSSDLKASSMAEVVNEYDVPEFFVENETRSTVTSQME